MTRRLFSALLPAALAAQETVIRVDVRLVRILATVKNTAGEPVGTLEREDFEVFDNGVPQQLSVFERYTEQPLSVAVLIDTSASTAIELRYEIDSVQRFLKALLGEGNPQDAAALFSFNHQVTQEAGFARGLDRLERVLKGLKNQGGTSLYDAIFLASRNLEGREGRHVMVVVTDGGDTTSEKNFHQALEAAQMADAVLYPVLVIPVTNEPGRNIGGENALTGLAVGTGGRVFTPWAGPALDAAFTEILRELRTQYLLAYYPRNLPATKDRFHRLEVKVRRADLRVLARSGYYEGSEAGRGWSPAR